VLGYLASFTYRPVQRWGPVSPHGVGTAVGFLAGAMLMARRAEPRGIPRAEVYNAVTWGAVGALIGARGFYVLGHLSQFSNVKDVVAVWQGGLTMFGGFLGGLVLGLWYLRRKGFKIPPALDAAAPGFALGVLIGRIGDIIIADHLGRPTNFFLGYKIPNAKLAPGYGPPTYVPGAVVHHTALYDFIGTLVLFVFLFWYERRKQPTGALFATFALWYGVQRFLIDFTRNRTLIESHFFGLSGSQWAGLAFAAAGAIWLVRLRRRPAEVAAPAAEPEPVPVPIVESRPELSEPVGEMPPPMPSPQETPAAEPEPASAPVVPSAPEPAATIEPEPVVPTTPQPVVPPSPEPVVPTPPSEPVMPTTPEPVVPPTAPVDSPAAPPVDPVDPSAPEAVTFEPPVEQAPPDGRREDEEPPPGA